VTEVSFLRRGLAVAFLATLATVAAAPSVTASATVRSTAACPNRWTIVPSPSPGNVNNTLVDVDALSATDAWALGTKLQEEGPALFVLPLVLRWDGMTWSEVPTPSGFDAQLTGVLAFGANDAWSVGFIVGGITESVPLIEHWNGSSWRVVPSPHIRQANLLSIAGTGPTDIWAVGLVRGFSPHLLAEHYDGTSWGVVHTPTIASAYVDLESVTTIDPANVWAVGYSLADSGNDAALSLHWNGTRWKLVPVPDLGAAGSDLYDVTVTRSGAVWAVGQSADSSGTPTPLALRWTGTEWASPAPTQGASGVFHGAVATGADAVTAVGWRFDPSGTQHTLSESFLDGTWKVLAAPRRDVPSRLSDVTFDPAAGSLIAVGTATPVRFGKTLVETICP
jgi:hypothetical protein